ncbi:MAG TPA: nucleotidyltransferase domain-containing protein [Acidimicrobiia bacterium]|nr:nucleotidyltransferase domain-containing protein [Acidimicrobiia bacterium]
MDVGNPAGDVLAGARGAVLATLAQLEVAVTVRALARHAGVSPQGALQVINDLNRAGLVHLEPAGRSLMVTFNRHHLAAEPLLALLSLRSRLVERLTAELAGWDGLAGAWLFGSAARGDGDRDSDIDLLLVATRTVDSEEWSAAATRLVTRVELWTGNQVQLVEHTRRSFVDLARTGNSLLAAVRREGIPLTLKSRRLLRNVA